MKQPTIRYSVIKDQKTKKWYIEFENEPMLGIGDTERSCLKHAAYNLRKLARDFEKEIRAIDEVKERRYKKKPRGVSKRLIMLDDDSWSE